MRICGSVGGGRRLVRAAIGTVAMLLPGALAAAASAATLSVNKPCYVLAGRTAPTMLVGGTGYAPGDPVSITSSDGSVDANTTANAAGAFLVATNAPTPFFSEPGQKTVTLTASDFSANGTISATAPATVAPLAVATSPATARPSRKVTWLFSGFAPGRFVYVHYIRGKRVVARMRFGRATGACGLLRTKAHLYYSTHPSHLTYNIQVDDSKRYSIRARPRILGRIRPIGF